MNELAVYLGGEGANELGSYAGHPSYFDEQRLGVVPALLMRVQPTGWRIVGATKWSRIRKLRAHGPTPESRNVKALILDAREANAAVLAFTRDSDGDAERAREIRLAIADHVAAGSEPSVIGGVAIPVLEGWLLALQGALGTELLSKTAAEKLFEEKYGFLKDTEKVVAIVEGCDLATVARDASSLKEWLDRARQVFAARFPAADKPATPR